MKKYAIFTGILTACLICSASISAKAYTADDVAQRARSAGWPEYLIQAGYNEWASGSYSQDDLDEAYYAVQNYDEQTEEMICNMFGIEPQKPTEAQQQTTSSGNSETPDNSATQDDRIAPADFINMTLDEKIEYVNTLEESQKNEFLSGLTREERNSIIKQLPTDQKMTLMQNYIDTASSMGMNVVVDSVTDNNISLTVRDNQGIIIDKADVGIVIDETGISHTKPLVFAGLGILTAIAGFSLLYWYGKRTEQE
ncbi:MAG: hypothetical protein K2K06_10640 [Oscillospiraceae bacterium]|nr:hypothetical protein [Ruminococcus sp.]MDE6708477.1 hypothetical protein [Oscillospiraceae bacterium]